MTRARTTEALRGHVQETKEGKPPTVAAFRAAHALIGLSQADVAAMSGVSFATIARIKRYADDGPLACRPPTWRRLVRALQAAGVEFVDNESAIGVLRRKPARASYASARRGSSVAAKLKRTPRRPVTPHPPYGGT